MGEVPNLHVVLVEDLIVFVVLDHVGLDQFVVDHSRLNRLGVLLDLLLGFQGLPNVGVHLHKVVIFHLNFTL
jgi:hypothetical protein